MENQMVKALLKKAIEECDAIYEEYCRPKRDIVMIAECDMIKDAISLLLKAYLHNNGVTNYESSNLSELLTQCTAVDRAFNELNLESISELDDESRMARNLASEDGLLIKCMNTLQQSRQLILTKIGVSELSLS